MCIDIMPVFAAYNLGVRNNIGYLGIGVISVGDTDCVWRGDRTDRR